MNRIKLLLIPAVCAMLALSSCKVCKQCYEYAGEDGNGNPTYSSASSEKCGNELKDAEDEMTDPIIGDSHRKYDCRLD
ncbi:MAG: hypothetical protein M0D57_10840 [Sphingobacteriales bacterium JAD_PAG50586_3]|nr:MAG: hypothetical protein M0D57_10840 [Sphingobacteriales bacterium JAD_PAG50586_3]